MSIHVRVAGYLWILAGVALGTWAVWGLVTEEHSKSVVESWLIALGFAVLAVVAGVTFGRTAILGRVLIRLVSIFALLYSAVWFFLGGMDDASSYAPGIAFATVLAIYALVASRRTPSAT
jgi:hypothetical protein